MRNSNCCSKSTFEQRKSKYQEKKLQILIMLRDSFERRLCSINASIEKLEEQITRDKQSSAPIVSED